MKIFLADTVLNQRAEIPQNFCVDSRRQVQTEYAIDSNNAKLFDRKNTKTNLSFTLTRSHPNESSAELFALEHAVTLKNLLPCALKFESSKSYCLRGARLARIRCKIDGILTKTYYEFISEELEISL